MVIKLKTETLQNGLFYISKIGFKTRVVQEVYKCVQFKFNAGLLSLYAYNGTEACEFFYGNIDVFESFSRTVDFNILNKLISHSKSEFIECDFTEKQLIIKEQKSRYELQYMFQESLSYIFEGFNPAKPFLVQFDIKCLEDALFFVNPCLPPAGEALAYLNGIYFDGNAVVTDKISIAIYPILEKPLSQPLFISFESFKIMAKSASKGGIGSIYVIDDKLIFTTGTFRYLLRLMSNPFPNYKSVVTSLQSLAHTVLVKTEDITAACKKLVALGVKYGFVTFSKDKISLKASSDAAQGQEDVDIVHSITLKDDTAIELKMPFEKLLACLLHIKGKEIVFAFDSVSKQYIIREDKAIYINSIFKK
jgi:DNA polymerase III sliding clamp (beta) subunit (PCNA family)